MNQKMKCNGCAINCEILMHDLIIPMHVINDETQCPFFKPFRIQLVIPDK